MLTLATVVTVTAAVVLPAALVVAVVAVRRFRAERRADRLAAVLAPYTVDRFACPGRSCPLHGARHVHGNRDARQAERDTFGRFTESDWTTWTATPLDRV